MIAYLCVFDTAQCTMIQRYFRRTIQAAKRVRQQRQMLDGMLHKKETIALHQEHTCFHQALHYITEVKVFEPVSWGVQKLVFW